MAYTEGGWSPLLVRYDKTELLRHQKGGISRTANNELVARDTWNLIRIPITIDMLINPPTDNIKRYYATTENNGTRFTQPLRDYHNHVKSELYKKIAPVTSCLMDVACGRGGDIKKWKESKIRTVIGVELNEFNIEEINERLEVLKRNDATVFTSKQPLKNTRYVFMQMDASKLFFDQLNSIENSNSKREAMIIWGKLRPSEGVDRRSLYRLASNGFDSVSCQFAIHYMFQNNNSLKYFITNVEQNLKNNGYFIGTCLDGDTVHERLKNEGPRLSHVENDLIIWSITKKYEDKNY